MQSREAKIMDNKNILFCEIEFTFKDILNDPSFYMRELVIPWLNEGNNPEIIG